MLAFLIDADNLCNAAWLEEACARLESEEGALAVRRAYGSPDKLRDLTEVFRRRSIRAYPNLPLSKNTTDIALAVDAMELVCRTPAPKVVAIGSGDADFVPLVVRLREHGVRVICVSERSKVTADAQNAFDKVILVGPIAEPAPVDRVPPPAADPVVKAGPKTEARSDSPQVQTVKPAVAKAPAAKAISPIEKVTVQQILKAVPALKAGDWEHLSEVVKTLHERKLLSKSASSPKLFGRFPHLFELKPKKQPNEVRYIPPPA